MELGNGMEALGRGWIIEAKEYLHGKCYKGGSTWQTVEVGWRDWDSERDSDLPNFKKSGAQRLAALSSKPIPPSLLPPPPPKPQPGPVRGPLSTWQRLWTHQMLHTFFSWEHFPANLAITICSCQVLASGNWTRVICTNSGHNPWELLYGLLCIPLFPICASRSTGLPSPGE